MKWIRNVPFLAAIVLVTGAVFQTQFALIRVDGSSMLPTHNNGDLVLVWRGAFKNRLPQRGDVVVAQTRNDLIIKRVLGLPSETAEIRDGTLFINDQPWRESWDLKIGKVNVGRGELGQNRYALFGDNRDIPKDQMIAAVLPREQFLGKVVWTFSWREVWPGVEEREEPLADE